MDLFFSSQELALKEMKRRTKKDDVNTPVDAKKSEQLQKKVTGAHKEIDLNMFQSTYSKCIYSLLNSFLQHSTRSVDFHNCKMNDVFRP